jgi:transcriptional regulator with XRE-family HTH domain
MARALTGFSRQELYEKIGIATSTIDTWESGRVELTEKSAARVCEALGKVGIHCTSEWLLTGTGNPPRMMREVERSIFSHDKIEISNHDPIVKKISFGAPAFLEEDIRRDLSFFMGIHTNALFHVLEEDFMNSRYRKSDCVAGETEDLKSLEGSIVIGQLQDGGTILCKLLKSSNGESEISLGKKINKTIRLSQAAAIIWHRISRVGRKREISVS